MLLVMAITLGACAPQQQGTETSDAPSQAPASVAPASQSPEVTDSPEASESPEASPTNDPTPPDYDY